MATFKETHVKANRLFVCLSELAADSKNPIESEYYENLLNQFSPVLQSLNRLETKQQKEKRS